MKLAIGISTMNENIINLHDKLINIPKEITIIISHQITTDSCENAYLEKQENIHIVKSFEKGLSKSRNVLLSTASKLEVDYLIISDDDVDYSVIGLQELEKFLSTNRVNLMHYQLQSLCNDNELRKTYRSEPFILGLRNVFSVSSIEMCLCIPLINKSSIKFDENFGLGTKYPAGEEPIFLSDVLRSGQKIQFIPIPVTIHPIESSGMKIYYDEKALSIRSMIFKRCAGRFFGTLYTFAFWFKKFVLNPPGHGKIKAGRAIYIMLTGMCHDK